MVCLTRTSRYRSKRRSWLVPLLPTNARVFALRYCCCHPVVFISARGRHNQQPTKSLHEEEEDLSSWLTPAFLVLPKTKTRKNWKVYQLFCILSVFSLSHRIHCSWRLFFIIWPTYFLGIVRNHVSLGSPNHNLHTRSYRGIFRMYLWYSKKKGVNVGNPRHKNTVSGSVLCCHNREMSAKSADIWLSGRHVADMSLTFPAKLYNHTQAVRLICNGIVYAFDKDNLGSMFFKRNLHPIRGKA